VYIIMPLFKSDNTSSGRDGGKSEGS